jgi:glycosyltransferase involved in cell wall biosynthesis
VFQFYHQLAREIWFFEFPFLVNLIGYLFLEPIALILQSTITRLKGIKIITISNSSKQDLKRFGFAQSNIHIISEGIENEPIDKLEDSLPKESNFTVLFHSSLRDMKRPIEVFKSFNLFLKKFKSNSETPTSHSEPDSESTNKKITPKLWISGGGDQSKLRKYAEDNSFIDNVVFYGRTTDEQKFELMQRAHVICSTSIKEGWGLIVTEANSQGTPAISYDVDGLRDSTRFGGGIVVNPNSESMSKALIDLQKMVEDRPDEYLELRQSALSSAKKITFEQSYKDFKSIIEI